jgi:hypothetical protein
MAAEKVNTQMQPVTEYDMHATKSKNKSKEKLNTFLLCVKFKQTLILIQGGVRGCDGFP